MPFQINFVMLEFFAYGAVGATLATMVREGKIYLPRITVEREGSASKPWHVIDLGFVANTCGGGLLAMIVDHRPEVALTCGVTVAFLGRDAFKPLITRAFKHFQLNVSFGLPEVPPADPSQKAVNP